MAVTRLRSVRPSAVAGLFYPADPGELTAGIEALLDVPGTATPIESSPMLRALLVPHAGYLYSGPIAASAYRLLGPARRLRRIVVLGPSHYESFLGMALPKVAGFATPLGTMELDVAALRDLRALPGVFCSDGPHAPEHSLEVQLPFLQRLAGTATLVPIVTGTASPAEVEAVIDALWDEQTLIIASSDLSHYHAYESAQVLDAATAQAILEGREDLSAEQACGCVAVNGLVRAARKRRLAAKLLDLRNSADTAGERHRVVGYSAFAWHAASDR